MPLWKRNKKSDEKPPLPEGGAQPYMTSSAYPSQPAAAAASYNQYAQPRPEYETSAPPLYEEVVGTRPKNNYGPPQQPGYGQPPQQGYGPPQQQGYGPPQQQGYGPPQQPGYGPPPPAYNYQRQPRQPPNTTVIVQGGFDAGARFDGIAQPNIPPPPPGCMPNAAQLAASQGQNVVVTQKSGNFWSGGSDGGYVIF